MVLDGREITATAEGKGQEMLESAELFVADWLTDDTDFEKQLIAMGFIDLIGGYIDGDVSVPEDLESDQVFDYLLGQAVNWELNRQKKVDRLVGVMALGEQNA